MIANIIPSRVSAVFIGVKINPITNSAFGETIEVDKNSDTANVVIVYIKKLNSQLTYLAPNITCISNKESHP